MPLEAALRGRPPRAPSAAASGHRLNYRISWVFLDPPRLRPEAARRPTRGKCPRGYPQVNESASLRVFYSDDFFAEVFAAQHADERAGRRGQAKGDVFAVANFAGLDPRCQRRDGS